MFKSSSLAVTLSILLALGSLPAFAGDDFKPVSPAELAMKDNPQQPGAHAMILEWIDKENDADQSADHYYRVKIFTEEGKKYADIEIPFAEGYSKVSDVKARTVHPDGKVIPFTGQIYDKLVVKSKDVKVQSKTFSLPDVQPGSVIEYSYKTSWDGIFDTSWQLQDELFIKQAHFSIKPATFSNYGLAWAGRGIQQGQSVENKNGFYSLEVHDAPAFETEQFAPPERELKPHINFFYVPLNIGTKENFWKLVGQATNKDIEGFIGNRSAIKTAAAGMAAPGDTAEVKLKKIYDRVQQLKNLSYTREKTQQEAKRDKTKEAKNSEDVLKRGYGYHSDLNRLYVALVRAVGIDAYILPTSQRDRVFFKPDWLDPSQLSREIVVVNLGEQKLYLDPGTAMCPFGLIPWKVTGSQAYQVSKDGGTFVSTPEPDSKTAITHRTATLKLSDENLTGKIQVEYRDQEALRWRLSEITSDEAEVKKDLEDDMKKMLPTGSTVTLTGIENTTSEYEPLIVKYDVEIPSTGSIVGSRVLLPMEVFETRNINPFSHEDRANPIYFSYPYQEIDSVAVELPVGFSVENLPEDKKTRSAFGTYEATWSQDRNTLSMERQLTVTKTLVPLENYSEVRALFGRVASYDRENVVLQAQKTVSK